MVATVPSPYESFVILPLESSVGVPTSAVPVARAVRLPLICELGDNKGAQNSALATNASPMDRTCRKGRMRFIFISYFLSICIEI
jgi:hypothetical protein